MGSSYYAGDSNYGAGDNPNYGAGGLFGTLGKLVGGVGKALIRSTPVGTALSIGSSLLSSGTQSRALVGPSAPMYPTPVGYREKEPGVTGFVHRLVPGGHSGFLPRRRRMNPTNVKALRRAGRRVKGFLRIARRLGALPVAHGKSKKLFRHARRKK